MFQNFFPNFSRVFLTFIALFVCSHHVLGQTRCFTSDEINNMLAQLNGRAPVTFNKKLREELIKLKAKNKQRLDEDIRNNRRPEVMMEHLRSEREKNTARLCAILKQHGWPTIGLVDSDGVEAAFYVLKNSSVTQLKYDLVPVIVAAAKLGEIPWADFAGFVDRLRLDAGLKQLFGTQATVLDGFMVLFPIEAEKHVDARRKQYDLPPLADYLRFLQVQYRLPLIKSTGTLTNRFSDSLKNSIARSTAAELFEGETVEEDEVVRVDTNLVSMNVSVYSSKLRTNVSTLTEKDFAIHEDGHQESISFFAATDVPFDLVLLLDLSGSTANKRNLLRKSTQRFIEATRPSDRIAIVTFSDTTSVISPLTDDRAKLLESIKAIDDEKGGSHVWDALKFTLDEVIGPKSLARRRAVVFMTDGVDNSLSAAHIGSSITFADLLEAVRRNDALIIPIYLDTEGDDYSTSFTNRLYENGRKTLALLADESGGLYYKAKKIEDLNGVYGQVIEDLGKIYSLGYKPTNEKRDGRWRAVKIELPNQPELQPRTRPGYYAN